MGANLSWINYKTDNVEEAKTKFRADQESDRYENGHSYSGGIGMCDGISNKIQKFETWEEAIEWLDDNAEKWGCAEVIEFKDKNGDTHFLIGGLCSS